MSTVISSVIMVSFGNQNFLIGAQTNSEALGEAQKILEEAAATARKDFRMVNPSSATTTPDGYYKIWTDINSPTTNNFLTKEVTAHVSWTDDSKISRHVEMSTLVSNFENVSSGDTCNSFLSGNWKNPTVTNFSLGNLIGDISNAYPITDLDASNGKLHVTVNQSSQNLGPKNAGTGNDDSSVGSLPWNNPEKIVASDNASATASINGAISTHYLLAQNFGFTIPPGATILGIKVEIERSRGSAGAGSVLDKEIKIVKSDGTIGTTNKATLNPWPSADTYAVYGNSGDLWGETWSPSEINNSNFGVALSAIGSSASTRTASVDHVRITVTYIKQLYIFNLADPKNPTFYSGLGSNSTITSGFNTLATDGHFAYVATDSGPASGQLQIIDVSVDPAEVLSTYTIPTVTGNGGQALGNSIFYKNGYVYLGLTKTNSGPEFNIIDVRDPGNPTLVGGYSIGSAINKMYVRGNTAYLTTSDQAKEIVVLDVSNPSSPNLKFFYNALPEQSGFGFGRSLYVVGDRWFLGRTYISTAPEFISLDASSTIPKILQTKDVGPNSSNPFSLNGLLVRDSLAFLLLGSATKGGQLQILNATSTASFAPAIPWPNNTTGVGGVALDCEGNYLYVGSVDASNTGYITTVTSS